MNSSEDEKEKKRKPRKGEGSSSSDSSDSSDEKKKKKKGNKKKKRKMKEISPDSDSDQGDMSSEVIEIECSSQCYLSTGENKPSFFWVVDEDNSDFISLIFGVLDEKGYLELGGRLPLGLKGSNTNEGLQRTLDFLDHFDSLKQKGVDLFESHDLKKSWINSGRWALTFINNKSALAKKGKETQSEREQHNRDAKIKAFDGLSTFVLRHSTRDSRQNALFEPNSFAEVEDLSYKRFSVNNDKKNDKYLGRKVCCVINHNFEWFLENQPQDGHPLDFNPNQPMEEADKAICFLTIVARQEEKATGRSDSESVCYWLCGECFRVGGSVKRSGYSEILFYMVELELILLGTEDESAPINIQKKNTLEKVGLGRLKLAEAERSIRKFGYKGSVNQFGGAQLLIQTARSVGWIGRDVKTPVYLGDVVKYIWMKSGGGQGWGEEEEYRWGIVREILQPEYSESAIHGNFVTVEMVPKTFIIKDLTSFLRHDGGTRGSQYDGYVNCVYNNNIILPDPREVSEPLPEFDFDQQGVHSDWLTVNKDKMGPTFLKNWWELYGTFTDPEGRKEELKKSRGKINILEVAGGKGTGILALVEGLGVDPKMIRVFVCEDKDNRCALENRMATIPDEVDQYWLGGVEKLTGEVLKKLTDEIGPIHLIFASLPCQDFSTACSQHNDWTVDNRFENENGAKFVGFGKVVKLVQKSNPRCIVISENVVSTIEVRKRMNSLVGVNNVTFNVSEVYEATNRPRIVHMNSPIFPSRLHPAGTKKELLGDKNMEALQIKTLRASHRNGPVGGPVLYDPNISDYKRGITPNEADLFMGCKFGSTSSACCFSKKKDASGFKLMKKRPETEYTLTDAERWFLIGNSFNKLWFAHLLESVKFLFFDELSAADKSNFRNLRKCGTEMEDYKAVDASLDYDSDTTTNVIAPRDVIVVDSDSDFDGVPTPGELDVMRAMTESLAEAAAEKERLSGKGSPSSNGSGSMSGNTDGENESGKDESASDTEPPKMNEEDEFDREDRDLAEAIDRSLEHQPRMRKGMYEDDYQES
ncbi:hypothetical protein TrVE_jg9839 [Triparma verrucosa]|uniref:Uncharacterized protein n=1 Tax=Triparma verrucosa TaxID=1606542 RepID=A0A9W7CBP3_9STRA|nr:hypothetical protein TrVE_jg9839 [Triparma verrucosa]